MPEPLGDRRGAILRAIVREYVRSGEPVGSKHVVDSAKLGVSPATVRNEMARLEELGYLVQPHTSAGRIPTDAGYRFLVDQITKIKPLSASKSKALENELGTSSGSMDELLKHAGEVVSTLTRQVAALAALRSETSDVALRRIELFSAGSHAVQVVLIAENGRLEQRVVAVGAELAPDDLDGLGEKLLDELRGLPLADVESGLREAAIGERGAVAELLAGIAEGALALSSAEEHVFIGGVSNLAREGSFERGTLTRVYEALERQTEVAELLSDTMEDSVEVRIGHELDKTEFDACSLVIAGFRTADGGRGTLGIIGPTRLDYERMMSTAAEAARVIGHTLGEE